MQNRPFLKTRIIFTAMMIMFFSLLTAASGEEYVTVTKDGVNIRSGPGTEKEVLWEVFKGFPLKVVKKENKWVQVMDFEGDSGWISSALLSSQRAVIVKAENANMRIGAGKDYEVMASVKYGVVFTPVEREGEWVKVKHDDGTTGWIHSKLLWPESF